MGFGQGRVMFVRSEEERLHALLDPVVRLSGVPFEEVREAAEKNPKRYAEILEKCEVKKPR